MIYLKGLDEFLKFFGHITVLEVVEVVLAGVFLFLLYKKVHDYLIKKHECEKERDAKIDEALSATRKYPEYRQQSIGIQNSLEREIQELRISQEREIQELRASQQETTKRLIKMEENTQRRERNKARNRLIEAYRHYTNPATNPTLSWTKMEAEAFWESFRDYEQDGGDGYIHTDVEPAMHNLTVVDNN